MLSQTVEYALRAMVYLALHTKEATTTEKISEAVKVPVPYLAKVLQSLRKGGLIESQRGLGGGMTLARPPEKITILDIVSLLDPIPRIRSCPLEISSHGAKLCALHRRLDQAYQGVEQAFGSSTLAEILAEPNRSQPLCQEGTKLKSLS